MGVPEVLGQKALKNGAGQRPGAKLCQVPRQLLAPSYPEDEPVRCGSFMVIDGR